MMGKKVLVITSESSYAVGNLFIKALIDSGHEVSAFDLFKSLSKYIRGGFIGKKVNTFWPVEAWRRKANRELAVFIQEFKPDHLFISGDNPVNIGTLAFAHSILPNLRVTQFWPDTLVNLSMSVTHMSSQVDIMASYSSTALEQFKAMGYRECVWMPFAGDVDFLVEQESEVFQEKFDFDCSFVGGWRPERERALSNIAKSLPSIRLKIVGPLWSKKVRNKSLLPFIDDKPKYGKAFGAFIRTSRINLNIIDDTNFPAANMRFFEIPAAGGLQLSSSCPEQANLFVDGEHLFYFSDLENMVEKIAFILAHPDLATKIRKQSHQYIKDHHTYHHRMKLIL